jgi:hypothetical protein
MPKILAENSCGKFRRRIPAENLGENSCGKFRRKIPAENSCGKFRCLTKFVQVYTIHAPGKIQTCDRTMVDIEISAPW